MLASPLWMRPACAAVIALIFAWHSPPTLYAADRSWIDPAGGFFSDTANWNGSVIPGTSDLAIFNQSSTYTVVFTANITNDRLRISNDTVTFNLGGRTYSLTSTASASISVGGNVIGHGQTAQVGRLTLTGGTLNGVDALIGTNALGSGSVTVSTGATLTTTGLLYIGMGTPGGLSIINGGDVNTLFGTVGFDSNGTATISGTGSTWNVNTNPAAHLDVGGNGTGTLTVQNGGKLTTISASVGPVGAPVSTATVVGANSRWDQTSYLRVGEFGSGILNIQSGALVSNTSTTQDSIIGDQYGSNGTVNVNAGTWSIASRSLSVGYLGTGTLNITNGGSVFTPTNDVNIAYGGITPCSVSVTGTNSRLGARSVYVGGHAGGLGSTGVLTVGGGGEVNVGVNNVLKIWPAGTVHLSAGGTINAGSLAVQSGGTFDWTGGTLNLTNTNLDLGPGAPLGPNLTVGAGQVLSVAQGLRTGAGGSGAITVNGGGLVTSNDATAGYAAGATGSATIDGAGSIWNCSRTFTVGGAGNGNLTVSGGGFLESVGTALIEPSGVLGDLPGKTGTATITGPGSTWHAYGFPAAPTIFLVGNSGTGTLNITAGGVVAHEASDAIVANNTGSHGAVTVAGPDSRWTIDTYYLVIGSHGSATLDISAGGLIENPFGLTTLGQYPGSSGTATVSGPDSRWDGFQVVVGGDGPGHVSIDNGGALTASEIYVAAYNGSAGDITVDGPGASIIATTGFGYLIPGSAGTGSLTVRNGALVHCLEAIIGDGNTATGTLVLTGAGSQLVAEDEIDVGFFGTGRLEVHAGCTASTLGTIRVNSTSTLDLAGGDLAAADLNLVGGVLIGEGTITADVTNAGRVAVGHSPGTLNVAGTYSQSAAGSLEIELAGSAPGTGYDQLVVSGAAALDGTLHVSLSGGFLPVLGQSFTILTAGSVTGTFAILVTSPSTLGVNVSYNAQSVVLQVTQAPAPNGDLDGDGDADKDDVAAFKTCFSGPTVAYAGDCAKADFDQDGDVDEDDFGGFQRCFAGPGAPPACAP